MAFDWDDMDAIYNNRRCTDERKNREAARLFKAVCFATHAQHKPSGTSGGRMANRAMSKHSGYCADSRTVNRSDCSDLPWMALVSDGLSNGHPIIYQGETADHENVHAFVPDGYDDDGLVHVNWGWGRQNDYDGYFSIDMLKPNNADRNYSTKQAMYLYLRPEGQKLAMNELVASQPGTLGRLLDTSPCVRA